MYEVIKYGSVGLAFICIICIFISSKKNSKNKNN